MKNFFKFKQEIQEKRFNDILKQFGRDRDWIDWCKEYKKEIETFVRGKGRKSLDQDAEDDLIDWAVENDYMAGPDDDRSLDRFYDKYLLGK